MSPGGLRDTFVYISCYVRYIAVGMDEEGDEVFYEKRLPNCYLHLAWERRSYLDKRSPVSVSLLSGIIFCNCLEPTCFTCVLLALGWRFM